MFLIEDKIYATELYSNNTRVSSQDFSSVKIEAITEKRISERFIFTRFMDWTAEAIAENEKMWAEENADKMNKRKNNSRI